MASFVPLFSHYAAVVFQSFAIYEFLLMIIEKYSVFQPDHSPLQVTVLVLAEASILCVASTIDPLRAANRISGKTVFNWKLVSLTGEPPVTTSGLPIAVQGKFVPSEKTDLLIIIGGFGTKSQGAAALLAALRQASRSARMYGGIEAGTWLLGRAGLLNGRKATTHWEDMEDFIATFPEADIRPDRYIIDGPVFTAGGASPAFDLMLHLIRTRLGIATALDVASVFIYDQIRSASDAQPLVSLGKLEGYDLRLVRAIRAMEAHIDRPLTIATIAKRSGISVRMLEKIFFQSIHETPGSYYLRLRLYAARRLVIDTALPMAEIASRTGFTSAAGFSRAFAKLFTLPPNRMRKPVSGKCV